MMFKDSHDFKPCSVSIPLPSGRHYLGQLVPGIGTGGFEKPTFYPDRNPAELEGAHAWKKARKLLTQPDFSFVEPIVELKDFKHEILASVKSFNALKNSGASWADLTLAVKNIVKDVRDGVRDLIKDTTTINNHRIILRDGKAMTKQAAEHYLSYNFAWAQLYRDICSFLDAAAKASSRAEDLIKYNNREQRIHGGLHNSTEGTEVPIERPLGTLLPHLNAFAFEGMQGKVVSKRTFMVWFTGYFVYQLPERKTSRPEYKKALSRALSSSGTLTPSVLYNLTPWTWLYDYFTETGNMFDAISSGVEDSLVATGFYVMKHEEVTTTTEISGTYFTNGDGDTQSFSCQSILNTKIKSRAIASPFGFGLTPEGTSAYQKSILYALGASRLRN